MECRSRALIFEPCPYHYTLLGSYAYYLSKIGYDVTLLVHEGCIPQQDLHGAWQFVSEVAFFHDSDWKDAREALESDKFDLIWITTINVPYRDDGRNLFEVLGCYPCPRDGLFGTLHDALQLEQCRIDVSRFAKIFTLTDKREVIPYSSSISLSYYGSPCLGKRLSYPLSLLSVGVSISLCGAMKYVSEDLCRNDYAVSLIGRKTRLRFWGAPLFDRFYQMIKGDRGPYGAQGYPHGLRNLFQAVRKLKILGQVDSETMYAIVKKADYLIANFEGKMLDIFSNQRVSGVALLSLGFNVPMLVNETIAQSWGFDETNSVVFPDGRFDIALKRIRDITQDEYRSIQSALLDKQEMELARSLDEIKGAIANWRNSHFIAESGK